MPLVVLGVVMVDFYHLRRLYDFFLRAIMPREDQHAIAIGYQQPVMPLVQRLRRAFAVGLRLRVAAIMVQLYDFRYGEILLRLDFFAVNLHN